jgi:hypothetical protein
MIIWLASYPRSGNTYLRLLLFHGLGLKTYSEYNDPLMEQLDMSEAVGHALLPGNLSELAAADECYLVKTHGLPSDDRPAVYLVRDGRDAVVSHARFLTEFMKHRGVVGRLERWLDVPRFSTLLRQLIVGHWRLDRMRYGGWSTNVLAWTRRTGGPLLVIRYEDLVAQPEVWLGRVVEAFSLRSGNQALRVPDFASLHARWPQFFRKGRAGAWREEMSDDMHALFWQHHGEGMRALGYT